MLFKTEIEELSELCSIVLCSLYKYWDIDKQKSLSLFCYKLFTLIDIPPSVIYTSLKYVQSLLVNNSELDEYSLFTVTLLLAYKYNEDYPPPFMLQWSYASMIPVKTLVLLESRILEQLGYSLYISPETFLLWTEECNVLFDIQLLLFTQPTTTTTNILNNDYHYYYDYSLQEDVPLWTLYQPEIPVTINDMWYPFL
ncbi:hypothetical protein G6F46_008112 [Rhizopus delemar]|uniref:Uncharacterized protein n=3 Tax=Rhizopus TaxID=4842 RepID=I1BNT2_RHIO9|nr:hypothetical protein RO3G_02566 [Rhizopus delemar RA 99-880]KAG1453124.1 hypothetical protein G6F55_008306 [Rhizopus delemar]KAG1538177.1 hypothetical protein G6F51_009926 [Rhizopus arrhizus]KAG1492334.1 hypothetical protein G6F54_009385 [Rhizopus delemar]KAG1505759.1 hypothetical protein G6F53_010118 [Rhizopus delemar]|eukprot:EIE77862.1 hypothetical protein RO3G_02566 [Rhizopus delemar RA 99-880]